MNKAVILAGGLGSRMRQVAKSDNELTTAQKNIAELGLKALMPITHLQRPFLDYSLASLAESGYEQICLVVPPEHSLIRKHCEQLNPKRIHIEFSIQQYPLGTADAVLSARSFTQDDPFLVINCDNYYPIEQLKKLRELPTAGLIGFERDALIALSNISKERILKYAILETDSHGFLTYIHEKPTHEAYQQFDSWDTLMISMTCWKFDPLIYEACNVIAPSVRGELELPDAVQYAIDHLHMKLKMIPAKASVLDLSCRSDIDSVSKQLENFLVDL